MSNQTVVQPRQAYEQFVLAYPQHCQLMHGFARRRQIPHAHNSFIENYWRYYSNDSFFNISTNGLPLNLFPTNIIRGQGGELPLLIGGSGWSVGTSKMLFLILFAQPCLVLDGTFSISNADKNAKANQNVL